MIMLRFAIYSTFFARGSSDAAFDYHYCNNLLNVIFKVAVYLLTVIVQDIPSTGLDIWTELKARSERSKVEGQLHLKLSLATREERDLPEDERQFETKQHCDLMSVFIDHELRKSQVSLSIF